MAQYQQWQCKHVSHHFIIFVGLEGACLQLFALLAINWEKKLFWQNWHVMSGNSNSNNQSPTHSWFYKHQSISVQWHSNNNNILLTIKDPCNDNWGNLLFQCNPLLKDKHLSIEILYDVSSRLFHSIAASICNMAF